MDTPEIQWFEVYHVNTVSPQLIAEKDNRPDTIDKSDRNADRVPPAQISLPEKRSKASDIDRGETSITAFVQSSEHDVLEYDIRVASSVNNWNVKNDISCGTVLAFFTDANEAGVNDIANTNNPIRLNDSYESFLVQEAYTLIKDNEDNDNFIILDVRTQEEYASGHLKNAINIDYFSTSFQNTLNSLAKDKTYLIYCRSGKRSSGAFQIMSTMNFRKVYNMVNGIEAWVMKNYKLSHNI
ncbi:rhodanese-like domain-containing protein [Candidatus Latescibacterota bacterium]